MTSSGLLLPLLLGLGSGLALIVAIGAQNVFVLRVGILGRHVLPVVAVCAASDAVLIAAGVVGLGPLVTAVPAVVLVLRWAGAAFLTLYAVSALRRAVHPQVLTASGGTSPLGAGRTVVAVLALTWLNPHVYLDTVLLLGALANAQGSTLRWAFGAGAALGSVLWFCALGFGARLLRGFFARPLSWRILDSVIAVTMLALAVKLASGR